MKNILRLLTGGIATALFALAAQAANLAPGAFSAGTVKGDVSYKTAGSAAYVPLAAGVALPQGATIKTGANSSVMVVFGSGSTAVIAADSEIEITKFEQELFSGPVPVDAEPAVSNTQLKLISGDITSKVAKLKKGSNYVIDTPVGAAGVRGTIFSVTFKKGDTTFTIAVVDGGVKFTRTDASGKVTETLVESGQKATIAVTRDSQGNVTEVKVDMGTVSSDDRKAAKDAVGEAKEDGIAGDKSKVSGNIITIVPVDTTQVGVSTN